MPEIENEFSAIRISLAAPEIIKDKWSFGEVTRPETINYRTLRPEKDGLFCERIFGPTKDWECYCGKYKKIRYKGVICDRCGVEVARSNVRRDRMGHISLAAPVAHIWFSKGTPSRLGLLLDLTPRNLERVIYFAQYLVTDVNDELRNLAIEHLRKAEEEQTDALHARFEDGTGEPVLTSDLNDHEESPSGDTTDDAKDVISDEVDGNVSEDAEDLESLISKLKANVAFQIDALEDIQVGQLMTENSYREMSSKYGELFSAKMGAEAALDLLNKLDLDDKKIKLQEEIRNSSGQRRKKAIKTLRVVEAFRKSENKPEWMLITTLPVLPPELRPMVQLDGGRFATSDLNDLYRRVINRNNRLKRLIGLHAPEIIVRNEKRMLQEAVDALIDNGRRGRAVSGSHNHKLKSLSDLLRGKQGRFRQNLLGKRVDYSGRSVITVGPNLALKECGIPRRMALELFKPFVMNQLVVRGYAHNIKSAKRLAERGRPEVWDILEEAVQKRPVLLNRAPTLHRLGIQAFKPKLVEGGAIQVHPLVCTAFNADFDGDQMAVHVPLSKLAVREAERIMLSDNNMMSPSSGEPIVAPTLDIVLGCYYMTMVKEKGKGSGGRFANFDDARLAYDLGQIDLCSMINVRNGAEWVDTTVGRIIFNEVLPAEIDFRNEEINKSVLRDLVADCYRKVGKEETARVVDAFKDLGFAYASKSGITIAINDVEVTDAKSGIIKKAEQRVAELEGAYMDGFLTEPDRHREVVQVWTETNEEITSVIEKNLRNYGGIYLMAASGAKGNIAQIKQMAGMRGLMSDPKGRIIDWPIKSSFREGLSVLEYFISTHGARKGLADTALRTADSGYLTRRLIDVAQECTIVGENCETERGIWASNDVDSPLATDFKEQILARKVLDAVIDPDTGEIIVDKNGLIDEDMVETLSKLKLPGIFVRSPMTCNTHRGVCAFCYGVSLGTMREPISGEAVGIIAAQSIGEPGTQLTMRTFHTGGIAGADITSGLPRVEELFEARAPKGEAVLTELEGAVEIDNSPDGRVIRITSQEEYGDEYTLPKNCKVLVSNGQSVIIGEKLATGSKKKSRGKNAGVVIPDVTARVSGVVKKSKGSIKIVWTDLEEREYQIPAASNVIVKDGDQVATGDSLTSGPKSPQEVLRIQGRDHVQRYLIDEVQKVYRSQGVTIHDKHIELIISQMLRKVRIDGTGDTDLLPGELVGQHRYEDVNASILAEGGEPATASPILLGITKASLNMDSFLAAASFQETTRVLTDASVSGATDRLRGLKENVIIGRLIPSRFDNSTEGRALLGLDDLDDEEETVDTSNVFAEKTRLREIEDTMGRVPVF